MVRAAEHQVGRREPQDPLSPAPNVPEPMRATRAARTHAAASTHGNEGASHPPKRRGKAGEGPGGPHVTPDPIDGSVTFSQHVPGQTRGRKVRSSIDDQGHESTLDTASWNPPRRAEVNQDKISGFQEKPRVPCSQAWRPNSDGLNTPPPSPGSGADGCIGYPGPRRGPVWSRC